jgi:predicted nucleic acid-binding protein
MDQREPVTSRHISSWLADVTRNHEVVNIDGTLVLHGHQLASNEQLSWSNALIVEAAILRRPERAAIRRILSAGAYP